MIDFQQIDLMLDSWIDSHRSEIIEEAQGLIRIPSVLGEPAEGAPYGIEPRRALDFVVDLATRYGLATKMLDGHAMHAEFGTGSGMVGVLSHVDVVPEGQDWTYPAFGGVVDKGRLIGRGAIDDKGPAIASLYAMFAIKETGVNIDKRVRAIVGADEETGFRCVAHYFAHEEMPDTGFTPDGSFPAIFAEKGIATPVLTSTIPSSSGSVRVVGISAGQRSNMVPDRATVQLDSVELHDVRIEKLSQTPGVSVEASRSGVLVTAEGISAHASYPDRGVNALAVLCQAIRASEIVPELDAWLESLQLLASDTTGAVIGIDGRDDVCGNLTCNLGVASTRERQLQVTFSVRYPVTWKGADVKARIAEKVTGTAFDLIGWADSPPLYVPEDDPLVKTLLGVYRSQTGDMAPPKTMGGGTYARALRKGIAFGPDFPGGPDVAHKADEYWDIEEMILATRIYAKAIVRLAVSNSQ